MVIEHIDEERVKLGEKALLDDHSRSLIYIGHDRQEKLWLLFQSTHPTLKVGGVVITDSAVKAQGTCLLYTSFVILSIHNGLVDIIDMLLHS